MKKLHSRRTFIKIGGVGTVFGLSGSVFSMAGCKSSEPGPDESSKLSISGVSIPSSIDVAAGKEITLSGKGILVGDQIRFTNTADTSQNFNSGVSTVNTDSFTFLLPQNFSTGRYQLTLIRSNQSLVLGTVLINVIVNTDIPDKAGMILKGVVFSSGKGIKDVVVSDGKEVTKTDENGVYYLASDKSTGFVFISIPGNYEVSYQGNIPQFFKTINKSSTAVEQNDFSLIEADNTNHTVITMADWHLANRNNDLEQFSNKVLPDVNETIKKYADLGSKVYVLTLGDMTWDAYWYSNNFGLKEYIPYMNRLDSPVFNLIGNHDYDPYYANDAEAEQKYKESLGPTYYSFNLGRVHYVVLDDIQYINTGGSQGNVGNRNYNDVLSQGQLDWLKKDLEAITDKNTPIVLATHIPLYKNPTLDKNQKQVNGLNLSNGSALIDSLKDFSSVHVLSGHLHVNYNVQEESFLTEHNTAAVCATWWWTGRNGYAGNHICKDGSPGGYGIWQMNDRDIQWKYKSIGYAEDYQFRTYDLNKVHITAAEFAPKSTEEELAKYSGAYARPSNGNEVLVNVWGYDPKWEIEVLENNNKLTVSRVEDLDPLHIISYEAFRLNAGATPTSAFVTDETTHLFKVKASSPTSTLQIKVTDRFGRVFTETMERPKTFKLDMK